MDMQGLVNMINDAGARERANYHLTLGDAIAFLEKASPDALVEFDRGGSPGEPHSYRGYYSDLSFEPTDRTVTAAEFLQECRKALGAAFEGYKGGDFVMSERTPLWCASYSNCGPAIIAAHNVDRKIMLVTKELHD